MCRCGPNHNNKRPVVPFASRFKKLWSKPIIRLLLMFLQGTRLRRHRRGGPVQPAGEEDRLPEPQPHQHAQLLQLQQQHGQPEQPTPARPGRLQRPHVRVHVSERKTSAREVSEFHVIFTTLLRFFRSFLRNQTALFGGNPRYENVPLIGRGSPPPSVRWVPEAKTFL